MSIKTHHKWAKILGLLCFLPFSSLAETYTVQSGDSLWRIAEKTKEPSVTVHQMIAAIHEKNVEVLGADIGNIRPGMELDIPTAAEATNASAGHATSLLGGSARQGAGLSRNARIDSIQKQISRIETEINQTIQAVQHSQSGFEQMIIQQEKAGQ